MKRGHGAIWRDKKRTEAEGEQWRQTKRRRSGFLKENTEKENEFQVEELTLKKQHQQQEAARQGQILALMQQQQQQTAVMMALIERLLPTNMVQDLCLSVLLTLPFAGLSVLTGVVII